MSKSAIYISKQSKQLGNILYMQNEKNKSYYQANGDNPKKYFHPLDTIFLTSYIL